VAASSLISACTVSSCRSMLTSLGPMLAAISWRRYLAQRNMPARKPISTPKKISTMTTARLSWKILKTSIVQPDAEGNLSICQVADRR
jgi:hypothetical protein